MITLIRAYQRFISPLFPRRCKYHPTCSAYAVQAIQTYGILRGTVLAGWRLLPEVPGHPIRRPDAFGALLITGGVAALTLGLVDGGSWGWAILGLTLIVRAGPVDAMRLKNSM